MGSSITDDEYGNAYVEALRNQRRAVAGGEAEPIGLRELLPAVGNQLGGGSAPIVIDGGTKTFTSDVCIPARESGHGYMIEYPEAKITRLSEIARRAGIQEVRIGVKPRQS